jgi:hypothetical protein
VRHLASHVLGRCLRRLPRDWQVRYGLTPMLVETFVDASRHAGTCLPDTPEQAAERLAWYAARWQIEVYEGDQGARCARLSW